jgi:hypothetical protein
MSVALRRDPVGQGSSPVSAGEPMTDVSRAGEPTLSFDTQRNETPARHLGEADPQVHAPHDHRVQLRRRELPVGPDAKTSNLGHRHRHDKWRADSAGELNGKCPDSAWLVEARLFP